MFAQRVLPHTRRGARLWEYNDAGGELLPPAATVSGVVVHYIEPPTYNFPVFQFVFSFHAHNYYYYYYSHTLGAQETFRIPQAFAAIIKRFKDCSNEPSWIGNNPTFHTIHRIPHPPSSTCLPSSIRPSFYNATATAPTLLLAALLFHYIFLPLLRLDLFSVPFLLLLLMLLALPRNPHQIQLVLQTPTHYSIKIYSICVWIQFMGIRKHWATHNIWTLTFCVPIAPRSSSSSGRGKRFRQKLLQQSAWILIK